MRRRAATSEVDTEDAFAAFDHELRSGQRMSQVGNTSTLVTLWSSREFSKRWFRSAPPPVEAFAMQETVRRIVVADDEEDIAGLLEFTLLDAGYSVQVARDGEEARELIFATLPDLVLLDVMMPGIDGLELLRLMRSDTQTSEIPVVMLTAKSADGDVWAGWQAGAAYYLTKPFDTMELLRCVASFAAARASVRTGSLR